MKTKGLLLTILAAFALVACSPVRVASSGSSIPHTCKKGDACNVTVAPTLTSASAGSADLDYDPIYLASDNKRVEIHWRFPSNTAGYGFCAALGDGVFLKDVDDPSQFEDMGATGNASGPKNKCKDQYHWRALNTQPGASYRYKILFHDGAGRAYAVDPWIVNGN